MRVIHTKDGRTLYKDDNGHWLRKGDAEKLLSKQKEPISQEDNGVGVKALMNLKGLGLPQAKKMWDGMSDEEKRDLITKTKEHEGSILRNVPGAKKVAFEKSLREVSDVRDPDKETQIAKQQEVADKLNGKKEMTQAEFNEQCKKIQEQYVGMDVKSFAEGLTAKNINEKLGIQATDQQKWALIHLFRDVAQYQQSYDEGKTPKIFSRFEVRQDKLYDPEDFMRQRFGKDLSIAFTVAGNTGHSYIDYLDTKHSFVFMGPKGGLTTYLNGKKIRLDTFDAANGDDWIEHKYSSKKGKKSE